MNSNTAAIEVARAQGRQTWPYEPLYLLFHESLPSFHMKSGLLDVPRLADALGCTAEGIYKWFRAGKLPSKRIRTILELMQAEPGGRVTPTLEQLYAFTN